MSVFNSDNDRWLLSKSTVDSHIGLKMAVRCSVPSLLLLAALVGTSSLAVAGSSLTSRARKDPECGSALWCTDDSCRSPECVCVPFTPAAPQFGVSAPNVFNAAIALL